MNHEFDKLVVISRTLLRVIWIQAGDLGAKSKIPQSPSLAWFELGSFKMTTVRWSRLSPWFSKGPSNDTMQASCDRNSKNPYVSMLPFHQSQKDIVPFKITPIVYWMLPYFHTALGLYPIIEYRGIGDKVILVAKTPDEVALRGSQ
jgi:hypothetical protein